MGPLEEFHEGGASGGSCSFYPSRDIWLSLDPSPLTGYLALPGIPRTGFKPCTEKPHVVSIAIGVAAKVSKQRCSKSTQVGADHQLKWWWTAKDVEAKVCKQLYAAFAQLFLLHFTFKFHLWVLQMPIDGNLQQEQTCTYD